MKKTHSETFYKVSFGPKNPKDRKHVNFNDVNKAIDFFNLQQARNLYVDAHEITVKTTETIKKLTR